MIIMKRTFRTDLFQQTLINLRGDKSQEEFAPILNINRASLSLYENGKQLPTVDFLSTVSQMANKSLDNFFEENEQNGLVYLCGNFADADKEKFYILRDIIRIKDKYKALERRVPTNG